MGDLRGLRVLTLRAEGQGSLLAAALGAAGAEVVQIPAIEMAPPPSCCALDAALITLRTFDWVVFTSGNGVRAFAARGARLGVPVAVRSVAVVGPATGRAVVDCGVAAQIDLMGESFVAEGLLEALAPEVAGRRVLVVRAVVGRDVLQEGLEAAGAEVTVVEAYQNVVPAGSAERLRDLFAAGGVDAIAFTSGSTVENLARMLQVAGVGLPGGLCLASIGPVTSGVLRGMGWGVSVEAGEATIAGLVEAIAGWA